MKISLQVVVAERRVQQAQIDRRNNQWIWSKSFEIMESDELKEKRMEKREQPKRLMGHHQVDQYTHYGSLRRRKERERIRGIIWKNSDGKLPKFGNNMDIQIQEAKWTSNMRNPKRPTPRHIVIKLSKDRETLKSRKKKATRHAQGIPNKISIDLSAKILQARRQWDDTFKLLKEKKTWQPRTLYP